jgi:hypothetical protein
MNQSQPGLWVTDPAAYRAKMDQLLGDRDPLDVLSATPDAVSRIAAEQPVAKMRSRPFPGKWTPNEIIGHLTDAEWVFGFRLRLILCEREPTIVGMDHDLWASGLHHNDADPGELVAMFSGLRRYNVPLWRRMTPADLKRTGRHNERGVESLGTMLRMAAGHDLSHIDQIQRYLEAASS